MIYPTIYLFIHPFILFSFFWFHFHNPGLVFLSIATLAVFIHTGMFFCMAAYQILTHSCKTPDLLKTVEKLTLTSMQTIKLYTLFAFSATYSDTHVSPVT